MSPAAETSNPEQSQSFLSTEEEVVAIVLLVRRMCKKVNFLDSSFGDDLEQAALLRLWRYRESIASVDGPHRKARIATHIKGAFMDQMRVLLNMGLVGGDPSVFARKVDEIYIESTTGGEQARYSRLDAEQAAGHLCRLPGESRQAVMLYCGGDSVAQIAKAQGVSRYSVEGRIGRGIAALRRWMHATKA